MMGSPVSSVDFPTFSDAAEVSFKAVERLEALLTKVVNKRHFSLAIPIMQRLPNRLPPAQGNFALISPHHIRDV